MDALACGIWVLPTIAAALYADPSDASVTWTNFVAGLAFCGSGTMAPAPAKADDPVTIAVLDGIAADLNHIWGLLSVAAAGVAYTK